MARIAGYAVFFKKKGTVHSKKCCKALYILFLTIKYMYFSSFFFENNCSWKRDIYAVNTHTNIQIFCLALF